MILKIYGKILLIIGLMNMANSIQANTFFGVDLDLVNVGVEVRVNDIAIYDDSNAGQLTVELPSPDSIVNGLNALTLFVKPPKVDKKFLQEFEAGAYVSAKFFRQDNNAEKEYLAILRLELDDKGELEVAKPSVLSEKDPVKVVIDRKTHSVSVFAEIKSPFPEWAWQGGRTIDNNKETYNALLGAYREVYDAMAGNDQPLLKKLYAARAKEAAIAYNLSGVDAGHEKISTGKDVLDPDIELHDFFDKDMLELQIFADGKLARLMTPSGVQPIVFLERNPTLLHLHKFMFYKHKNGQWIMIR